MEKQLLSAALQSRTSFNLILEHVNPKAKNKKDVRYSPEFRMLMEKIGAYYENDKNAAEVNMELLGELIEASVANAKHQERFKSLAQEALASETSVPNINTLIRMAKRHEAGDKLATKLINRDDITAELEEYNKLVADELIADDEDDKGFSGVDALERLLSKDSAEVGIKIRPPELMRAIGGRGLRPGNKVTMFARPEMGKSGFAITNAAGWAMDGLRVLYLINEDPAEALFFRAVSCLTGMTEDEVLADPSKAMELARKRGLDNLTFKDIHPGSVAEIDALVKKEKPDVLIVDQLRNLKSKADSRTNQLDEVARELRDVAKANGIVVLDITQAGESAEGKAVLTQTDIDSSKTGVPGANDLLIGIGGTLEHVATGYRVLTLCRNKVNGNHTSITVRINPMISRYTDV